MAFTSDLRVVSWAPQDAAPSSLATPEAGDSVVSQSVDLAEERSEPAGPGPARRPRPPKLYRIGEVVEYARLSRQTVHNYTTMGLLREANRTGGGHRLYDESVFQRLDEIAEMRLRGASIQQIRRHFTPAGPAETTEPPAGPPTQVTVKA